MKFLQKILFVAMIGVIAGSADVYGITEINLPANMPGRQLGARGGAALIARGGVQCEHVIISNTPAETAFIGAHGSKTVKRTAAVARHGNIFFPKNGTQPTTAQAAQNSCARIADTGLGTAGRAITNWYIETFGGSAGLAASVDAGAVVPVAINIPPMGFKNNLPHPIITHSTYTWRECFKKPCRLCCSPAMRRFWKAFRRIAENPVGRVLLYRILIEIRRQNAGNGACGDGIVLLPNVLDLRNLCRSIEVQYDVGGGNSFSPTEKRLRFDDSARTQSITLRITAGNLDTFRDPQNRTVDVAIFHEMLHWLHFLRHPVRLINSRSNLSTVYRYLLRSYYGDHHGISELYTWGAAPNDEEIRTILGAPNYNIPAHLAFMDYIGTFLPDNGGGTNIAAPAVGGVALRYIPEADRFLEGDDLSENVYRMARERNIALAGGVPAMAKHKMRFGHGSVINPINIGAGVGVPNRFRLAHLVATDCYAAITGHAIVGWGLASGEATQ